MHSKIFQTSIKPIDEMLDPYGLFEHCSNFADYVGDVALSGDDRDRQIGYLADDLSDFMTREGDTLVYTSKDGLEKFLGKWVADIHAKADNINIDNIFNIGSLFAVKKVCETTHLNSYFRFHIRDWSEPYPESMAELVEYVHTQMKEGDRLYIGSVIDYHF